jgi:cytochrome c oxidase accessory protein FixG
MSIVVSDQQEQTTRESNVFSDDAFRKRIATVDEQGKRKWVYPQNPKGAYHRARAVVAGFLVILFFSGPWITINGHPLLLMNLMERRFAILGVPFWPQDAIYLAIAFICMVVFLLLFTVVWGRLWCGWACPQTIFLEMVFRKIEYLFEGGPAKQRRLKTKKWNREKLLRKGGKWTAFFIVSFAVANTFLAYFVGTEGFLDRVSLDPRHHTADFIGVIGFTAFFYFIFAWFREQACTLLCPYARLQGVLLDNDSVAVTYDFTRGEERMAARKSKNYADAGDCIDCFSCVKVCPTGIDIRDGIQLECVNCTACMDACDSVMDKYNRPRGLIRYASHNMVKDGSKFRFTPRVIGYMIIFAALLIVFSALLLTRSDVDTTILRTPGQLYQEADEGATIQNLFNLKALNKTYDAMPLYLELIEPQGGEIQIVGTDLHINAEGILEQAFFVKLPRDILDPLKTKILIEVSNGDKVLETVKTTFLGPASP